MVTYLPFVSAPEDSELTDGAHLGWTGNKKPSIGFLLIRESMAVVEVGSVSVHVMIAEAHIVLSRAHMVTVGKAKVFLLPAFKSE